MFSNALNIGFVTLNALALPEGEGSFGIAFIGTWLRDKLKLRLFSSLRVYARGLSGLISVVLDSFDTSVQASFDSHCYQSLWKGIANRGRAVDACLYYGN